MIKLEQKNKWAIDLSLHIPLPSISFAITKTETETDLEINTPLHRFKQQVRTGSSQGLSRASSSSGNVQEEESTVMTSQAADPNHSDSTKSAAPEFAETKSTDFKSSGKEQGS